MSSTQFLDFWATAMDISEEGMQSERKSTLQRSVSSFDLNMDSFNPAVREAKSFSGALPELKTADNKQITMQQYDPNYYMKFLCEISNMTRESEYITKEISTDNIYVVKEDMLHSHGKQYSVKDIATRWKKDCRMWLWKNRKNRSMTNIRNRVQSGKLPKSSSSIKIYP